jgi:hypothetical protein
MLYLEDALERTTLNCKLKLEAPADVGAENWGIFLFRGSLMAP